jgi:hypothetical protein
MGSKPHTNFQSDRPESGGADKDGQREQSGQTERDKEMFAQKQAEEREDVPRQTDQGHDQFSVGSPRNPEK